MDKTSAGTAPQQTEKIDVVPCPAHPGDFDLVYLESGGNVRDRLHMRPREWADFLASMKAGDFDNLG